VQLLEKTALTALNEQAIVGEVDLGIMLTNDVEIQALNLNYRGYDKPTDVLSFEAHQTDPETGRLYLGDIVISLERAAAQAEQGGHPLLAETQLLVVHGVLHLLGHDHADTEEKAKMWWHQAEILARLGLSDMKIQEE
jgi:probable rRNA maturation factor